MGARPHSSLWTTSERFGGKEEESEHGNFMLFTSWHQWRTHEFIIQIRTIARKRENLERRYCNTYEMDDLSLHAKLTVKHICQGMQHDRLQYVLVRDILAY